MIATSRPSALRAFAHQRARARRDRTRVPCEKLRRTTSTPAASMRCSTAGSLQAGPSVATILVLRGTVNPLRIGLRSRAMLRGIRRAVGNARRNEVPLEYVPAMNGRRIDRSMADNPGASTCACNAICARAARCRDGAGVRRTRRGLRRAGREEGLHAAVVHDGRRQDAQGRQGRLRDVRQAQRGRRQRDLRPAFLHRHFARRRQVQGRPTRRPATGTRSSAPAGRSTPTSISSSAPTRSPTSTRRTRTSTTTGSGDRSIPTPASPTAMTFPGRDVSRLGARAQGAARLARRQEAAGGRRRVGRLDPGDGVGGAVSRTSSQRVVHVIGPGFDIHPYVIEMLDVWITADQARPEVEQRRLLRPRRARSTAWRKALKIMTITTRAFGWAEKTFGYKWADAAKDPGGGDGQRASRSRTR